MNYLQRPSIPTEIMKQPLRKNEQKKIAQWLALPADKRRQQPHMPPRLEQIPEAMAALHKVFHGKCAYCESSLSLKDARLAFFRPIEEYLWLLWDWTNLYIACRVCRDLKGSKFPIGRENRALPGTYGAARLRFIETPLLLDPCLDNPSFHLEFREDGTIEAKTNRGELTITTLELNRRSLCQARQVDIQSIQQVIDKGFDSNIVEELNHLCQDDQPFVGMRRQLLQRWFQIKRSSPDTPAEVKAALNEPLWQEFIKQLDMWHQLPSLAAELLEAYVHVLTYPDARSSQTQAERLAELDGVNRVPQSVWGGLEELSQEAGVDMKAIQSSTLLDSVRHIISVAQNNKRLDDVIEWLDNRCLPGVKPIQNRWALLIGINDYDEPAFASLNYCINDVVALEKLLENLGYTVIILHDDMAQKHLKPTRNNILAALTRICQIAEENDLIFVHFAGHGTQVNGEPVLVVSDAREPVLESTGILITELEEQMRSAIVRRLILTLDACHVGVEIGRSRSDYDLFIRNVYELAEGFALIAGSTAQQVACEWHEKEHGVFSYYLLKGISGAAKNEDNLVTVSQLKDFILDKLRRWNLQQGNILQEPTARIEGIGDMILGDYRDIPC
ncbi:MAG: caspase family protein [Chloroflexota bacterium]